MGSRKVFITVVGFSLAMGALTGCSAIPDSTPTVSSATVVDTTGILTRELPSDVSARGVVLAAVLLKVGNIDNALASGKITPAEVDEAMAAIADGTVDLWRQRAEADR